MVKLTIGERLKDERVNAGLTTTQVCEQLLKKYGYALSSGKLNEMESDKDKDFGYRAFVYLSRLYNVSTDYLLGRTDVRSTDTDVQGICEYTGLSEKSIKMLSDIKNEKIVRTANDGNEILSSLNDFLLSELCVDFFDMLAQIKKLSINKRFYEQFYEQEFNNMFDEIDNFKMQKGFMDEEYRYIEPEYRYNDRENKYTNEEKNLRYQFDGCTSATREIETIVSSLFDNVLNVQSSISQIGAFDLDTSIFFDEPQMLLEYKITKTLDKILEKLKCNTSSDREIFDLYINTIYSRLTDRIKHIDECIKSCRDSSDPIDNEFEKVYEYEKEATIEFVEFFARKYKPSR